MKPNSVWKGYFRLITHRHTHTPQLCVPHRLHSFQAGLFCLYVKRARTGNSVQCSRGPWLGQNSSLFHASESNWNHDSKTSLPRGSLLIADNLCWNWVSCSAVSHTNAGKRNWGHSTPEYPRVPAEYIWVSRHTQFQAVCLQQPKNQMRDF